MAATKITGLTQLSATPAAGDFIPIVDVSDATQAASGTTKKIRADRFLTTIGTAGVLDGTVAINSNGGNPRINYYLNGTSTWANYVSFANSFFSIVEVGVIDALSIKTGGNVGIGNTSPSYKLDVNGQAHASSFPTSSDMRLKENIRPLTLTPQIKQKLNQINAYLFEWKDDYAAVDDFRREDGVTKQTQVGFIAQEVQAAVPQLVTTWRHSKKQLGPDGETIEENIIEDALAVDYARFVPIMWEAIKELYARVAALENA